MGKKNGCDKKRRSWRTAKHIYSASSLSDTTRVAAFAWVISNLRNFSAENSRSRIGAGYAAKRCGRRGVGVIAVVTFVNWERGGERALPWRTGKVGVRARVFFLSRGIYPRSRGGPFRIALTSIIIFHRAHARARANARKRPDLWTDFRPNKHAPRRRRARRGAAFGIRGIREWQDAKWTGGVITFRERRISSFQLTSVPVIREGWGLGGKVEVCCERRRSINRRIDGAGEINFVPSRLGFRNLSAAPLRISETFRSMLYTDNRSERKHEFGIEGLRVSLWLFKSRVYLLCINVL